MKSAMLILSDRKIRKKSFVQLQLTFDAIFTTRLSFFHRTRVRDDTDPLYTQKRHERSL